MAAVIATAVTHGPSIETVVIALAYIAGAIVPIAIIAGWGRRASHALAGAVRGGRLRRGSGVAMLVTAALVATGLDFAVEDRIVGVLPTGWGGAPLPMDRARLTSRRRSAARCRQAWHWRTSDPPPS